MNIEVMVTTKLSYSRKRLVVLAHLLGRLIIIIIIVYLGT